MAFEVLNGYISTITKLYYIVLKFAILDTTNAAHGASFQNYVQQMGEMTFKGPPRAGDPGQHKCGIG